MKVQGRVVKAAMCLVCLAATAIAQQAASPPSDAPDVIVVSGERERQRKSTPAVNLANPDVITVMRSGDTRFRLQPARPGSEILFRRESIARQLPASDVNQSIELQRDRLVADSKKRIEDVTLEFAAYIEEADGLPAVIPFGPGLSIVNIDYVRVRDTGHRSLINVTNAIHVQTRSCVSLYGIADDQLDYPNRFILLGDRLSDCTRAVRNREGDLFFAEGIPERLQQDLRDVYGPVSNRFALKLGSEPGMVLVAWQPDSRSSNLRYKYSWSRSSLLLFNGQTWQNGLEPKLRDVLWESFAKEQILRRLQWKGEPDAFTLSAANYLLLLARFERDHSTNRQLLAELPNWIAACARDLGARAEAAGSAAVVVSSIDCGRVLQFVYDAVVRAKSSGEETIYRTWRTLLSDSYRRGESGVQPKSFIDASVDAQRIVQGLLQGSMDWPRFVEELNTLGVRLRIRPDPSGLAVEVLSLQNFHD